MHMVESVRMARLAIYLVTGTSGHVSQYKVLGSKSKGVTSSEYGNLLAQAIVPAASQLFQGRCWVLMQDNASAHTA